MPPVNKQYYPGSSVFTMRIFVFVHLGLSRATLAGFP